MAHREAEGSKYRATEKLSLVEVAKLIRADVKEAVSAGVLPRGLVLSVRVRHHSSIDTTITAAPFEVLSRAHVLASDALPHLHTGISRYTPLALCALARLEDIANAYNYDRSEVQSDYFNVRFYGHPSVSYVLEGQARDALRLELADALADLRVEYAHATATMAPGEASAALAESINFRFHPQGRNLNDSDRCVVAASSGCSWAELVTRYAPTTVAAVFTPRSPRDELTAQIEALRRENAALRKRRGIASESAHV